MIVFIGCRVIYLTHFTRFDSNPHAIGLKKFTKLKSSPLEKLTGKNIHKKSISQINLWINFKHENY